MFSTFIRKIFKKLFAKELNEYYPIDFNSYNKRSVIIRPGTKISNDTIIGNFSYLGFRCVVTKALIGRYVSIGDNVTIGPGEHNLTGISTSNYFNSNDYHELTSKECIIGNDVWIGVDSIVLRGVKVGDGVVIGANSVVTKDVPDFAIVVGSPAKIIKYRFPEHLRKLIKESAWWNLEQNDAKRVIQELEKKLYSNK